MQRSSSIKKRYILWLLILVCFELVVGQNENAFKEGNNLYNEGNYQEAVLIYESILEKGVHSAELYYNLGNAYYKLNSIAPSIYYYEKALQLKPHDSEIINNLAFANNMTIDAIDAVPEVGLTKLMKRIITMFSFDQWGYFSIGFSFLYVLLFILYFFSHFPGKKRVFFLSSIMSLILMFFSLFFAYQRFNLEEYDNPAIVFAQKSWVKSEPNLRSENAFELHEGTKVQVLEHFEKEWTKIELADGKTGWITTADIKEL